MSGAPRKKRDRPLSELEGCVLGHLWKRGASTPYAVRRMFLDSPSSHWSGSAGAVYPVLERLEERGLVAATHAPRGEREAWTYALTAAGRRRFRTWLEPPFAAEFVSVPPDPLRTRLSFLGVLDAAQRRRFLVRAVAALRQELAALARRHEEDEDERCAHAAAVHACEARVKCFAVLGRRARRSARAC
jgi:DNA-binding PadR family transcriptional regulator